MRRHNLEHINRPLCEVVTKQLTFHGHVIAEDMETAARNQRRKDTSVTQIGSDRRDGREMQWPIYCQTLQHELGVVDEIAMPDGYPFRYSGRAGGVDYVNKIVGRGNGRQISFRFRCQQVTMQTEVDCLASEIERVGALG